jgi:hypothetical protein
MTRQTLTEQFDSIEWGEEGQALYRALTAFDACDEGAAVVLISAAVLLARQEVDAYGLLEDLCAEFKALTFVVQRRLADDRWQPPLKAGPRLRLVGGTDVGGIDA